MDGPLWTLPLGAATRSMVRARDAWGWGRETRPPPADPLFFAHQRKEFPVRKSGPVLYIMRSQPTRTGRLGKRLPVAKISGAEFKTVRLTCPMSVPACAELLRVSERTVHNWEMGRARVPYAAYKLMRVLRLFDAPHPDWDGYRFSGGVLWSPEGHPFRPEHGRWWSLTCRMADEFRRQMRERYPIVQGEGARASAAPTTAPAKRALGLSLSPTRENKSDDLRSSPGIYGGQGVDGGANVGPEWGHPVGSPADARDGEVQFATAGGSQGPARGAGRGRGVEPQSAGGAGASKGGQVARGAPSAIGGGYQCWLDVTVSVPAPTPPGLCQESAVPVWQRSEGEGLLLPAVHGVGGGLAFGPARDSFSTSPAYAGGVPAGLYKAMADMPARGGLIAGRVPADSLAGGAP
jgi:DNA-binding transcriptional regulator YiaG